MSRILITGIAGFIGYSLAKKLASTTYDIVGIDNLNEYYDLELKLNRLRDLDLHHETSQEGAVKSEKYSNITFIQADISDVDSLENIFKAYNFTHIVHLAAQAGIRYSFENPQTYIQTNIVGTFNIFEMGRKYGIEHLIYASSSSVYGDNDAEILSTDMQCESPKNIYAVSKKSNELMAYSYASLYDMKITGLRFFTVYGPWGRPDMAPMLFADAITRNKPIKLFNNGDMYRDFTYIDDIVEGIVLVVNQQPSENYNILNIGNAAPVNMKKFVTIMEKKFHKKANIEYLPMQKGEVHKTYADVSQMKSLFNFSPNTDIEEGIDKFVSWYCDYYGVSRCVQ